MIEKIQIVEKHKQRENDGVKKDIMNWLEITLPKDSYVYYKNWGGGFYNRGGRPDIEIAYKGIVLYCELKDESGSLSTLQIAVIEKYRLAGIIVHVIMSLDEFKILWNKIHFGY